MPSTTHPAGNLALREGRLLGGVLGLVLVLLHLLDTLASGGLLVSALTLALTPGVYLLAGLRATSQTGRIQTGAYAGLLTALVSSAFSLTVSFVLLVAQPDRVTGLLNSINLLLKQAGIMDSLPLSVLIGALVISYLMVFCFSLLVGFALGALGGSLGKARRLAI